MKKLQKMIELYLLVEDLIVIQLIVDDHHKTVEKLSDDT